MVGRMYELEALRRAFAYSVVLVLEDYITDDRDRELRLFFQLPTSECSYDFITLAISRRLSRQTLFVLFNSYNRQHRGCNWVLFWCAVYNFVDLAARVLNQGADLHYMEERALRVAVLKGNDAVISLLLKRGANLHVCHDEPLFQAAYYGYASTVQLLLDNGADIHACQERALCWAVLCRHYEIADMLIQHGAHVSTALQSMQYYYCFNVTKAVLWLTSRADLYASSKNVALAKYPRSRVDSIIHNSI